MVESSIFGNPKFSMRTYQNSLIFFVLFERASPSTGHDGVPFSSGGSRRSAGVRPHSLLKLMHVVFQLCSFYFFQVFKENEGVVHYSVVWSAFFKGQIHSIRGGSDRPALLFSRTQEWNQLKNNKSVQSGRYQPWPHPLQNFLDPPLPFSVEKKILKNTIVVPRYPLKF